MQRRPGSETPSSSLSGNTHERLPTGLDDGNKLHRMNLIHGDASDLLLVVTVPSLSGGETRTTPPPDSLLTQMPDGDPATGPHTDEFDFGFQAQSNSTSQSSFMSVHPSTYSDSIV